MARNARTQGVPPPSVTCVNGVIMRVASDTNARLPLTEMDRPHPSPVISSSEHTKVHQNPQLTMPQRQREVSSVHDKVKQDGRDLRRKQHGNLIHDRFERRGIRAPEAGSPGINKHRRRCRKQSTSFNYTRLWKPCRLIINDHHVTISALMHLACDHSHEHYLLLGMAHRGSTNNHHWSHFKSELISKRKMDLPYVT
jgi:hypothetical protein